MLEVGKAYGKSLAEVEEMTPTEFALMVGLLQVRAEERADEMKKRGNPGQHTETLASFSRRR